MELASSMNDTTIFNLGGTVYAFNSVTVELCFALLYKNRWSVWLFFK